MARVKCIMMQRDEDLLLEGWLRYHGYLFGFENLEVFDNGSTNPKVIETLRTYEAAGCRVHWQYNQVIDFHGKGFHFKNVITNWDAALDYDFAFPLDCDEFMTVLTPNGISCSRSEIHDHLDTLRGERRALRVAHCLFNAPDRPGHFWAQPYPKCFGSPSKTVGTIDHGFHAVTSSVQDGVRGTNIAYLHFHNKPLDRTAQIKRRTSSTTLRYQGRHAARTDARKWTDLPAPIEGPGPESHGICILSDDGDDRSHGPTTLLWVTEAAPGDVRTARFASWTTAYTALTHASINKTSFAHTLAIDIRLRKALRLVQRDLPCIERMSGSASASTQAFDGRRIPWVAGRDTDGSDHEHACAVCHYLAFGYQAGCGRSPCMDEAGAYRRLLTSIKLRVLGPETCMDAIASL